MFMNTVRGEGFLPIGKYATASPSGSYWASHFSLTIFLFLPICVLIPSALTLFGIKSVALGASIVALWKLAKEFIDSDKLAGFVVLSYVLNPFLFSAWIYDFQEQILLPLLGFVLFYIYKKNKVIPFLAVSALMLFTNEFVIYIMFGFLVGCFVKSYREGDINFHEVSLELGHTSPKKRMIFYGLLLTIFAWLLSKAVLSHFAVYQGLPFRAVPDFLQGMVTPPRAEISELAGAMVRNPGVAVQSLTMDLGSKILAISVLLLPTLFLPVKEEITVFSIVPFFLYSWTIAQPVFYKLAAHYPLYIISFVYIGLVLGVSKLEESDIELRDQFMKITALMILFSLLLGFTQTAFLTQFTTFLGSTPSGEHKDIIKTTIDSIPDNESVVVQNNIYSHMANRANATTILIDKRAKLYEELYGPITPKYILFDKTLDTRKAPWWKEIYMSFEDRIGDEYGLYRYEDGVSLYKLNYHGTPKGNYSYKSTFGPQDLSLRAGKIENDTIVSTKKIGTHVWFGPYTFLPPGNYKVKFRLKTTAPLKLDVVKGRPKVTGTLSHRKINGTDGWETITLEAKVKETLTDAQFRGRKLGQGKVKLKYISVSLVGS